MKTPRAEQDGAERGDPNLGEATGPWLSRQCHLLPLHTHPHPTLQCWGWAPLGGEPRCFEAVAELLFPIFCGIQVGAAGTELWQKHEEDVQPQP